MFIAFSAECKLSASFLECTQCQMLSDLAVFTSNRECAKHCVWCGRRRMPEERRGVPGERGPADPLTCGFF